MAKQRLISILVEDHGGLDPIHRRLRLLDKAMRAAQLKVVRVTEVPEGEAKATGQKSPELTWQALVDLEPKLADLMTEVQAVRGGAGFCANRCWYEKFKPRLLGLVGWERADKHPVLCTERSYELAYAALYDALPDCSHQGTC